MVFLSQLLNKTIYLNDQKYAKVLDFTMDNLKSPFVTNAIVRKDGKKAEVSAKNIIFENGKLALKERPTLNPYNEKAFSLSDDLLDKQVIDITGKRLVRVNDIILKVNGGFAITGIDISFAGILRRLGLGMLPITIISIPWSAIEAFDYDTGDIRIKLGKNTLNTLHPADLADILEEAGTKERLGLLEALGSEKAADALEEADTETQQSILEELPKDQLKNILQHMSLTELADILPEVNTKTIQEIYSHLGADKTSKVKLLTHFAEDTAGGLMETDFFSVQENHTVEEVIQKASQQEIMPDVVVVLSSKNTLLGVIELKTLLTSTREALAKDVVRSTQVVPTDENFLDILELFAEYNLRILPVVNDKQEIQGVISIDALLSHIYTKEEEEHE